MVLKMTQYPTGGPIRQSYKNSKLLLVNKKAHINTIKILHSIVIQKNIIHNN